MIDWFEWTVNYGFVRTLVSCHGQDHATVGSGSCVEVNGCVPNLIAPPTTLCSIYIANLPWGASETSKNSLILTKKCTFMVVCILC